MSQLWCCEGHLTIHAHYWKNALTTITLIVSALSWSAYKSAIGRISISCRVSKFSSWLKDHCWYFSASSTLSVSRTYILRKAFFRLQSITGLFFALKGACTSLLCAFGPREREKNKKRAGGRAQLIISQSAASTQPLMRFQHRYFSESYLLALCCRSMPFLGISFSTLGKVAAAQQFFRAELHICQKWFSVWNRRRRPAGQQTAD